MHSCPRYWFCLAVVLLFSASWSAAQGTREDYHRAEQFLPANLRHRIYVADVAPHRIAKKNRFWYHKAGTNRAEFVLVDADQNNVGPAFDHVRLALAKALRREVQPTELPFDSIDFSEDGKSISFQIEAVPWSCGLENYECKRGPEPVAGQYEEASPNKVWVGYVEDHDLISRRRRQSIPDPAALGLFRALSARCKSAAGLRHSRRARRCHAAGAVKSMDRFAQSESLGEGGAPLNSIGTVAARVSRLRINSLLLKRKTLHLTSLAGLLGAIAGNANAQLPPQAPNSSVITLTPRPGYFTEPGIAINPNHPQQVIAVYQDNAHAAYSFDAGRSWQIATGVESTSYRVSGDVSTTFDNQGHAFVCYIAFDKLGTFNYWGHNSSRNGIYVRRSLDGGKTWESKDIVATEQPDKTLEQNDVPWEDKPYIVADNSHGPYAGNLYIGWTRWTVADSQIQFVRSTDHGKTWSNPLEIDNVRGLPRDDNGANEGFAGAVGPDSTLYVICSRRQSSGFHGILRRGAYFCADAQHH